MPSHDIDEPARDLPVTVLLSRTLVVPVDVLEQRRDPVGDLLPSRVVYVGRSRPVQNRADRADELADLCNRPLLYRGEEPLQRRIPRGDRRPDRISFVLQRELVQYLRLEHGEHRAHRCLLVQVEHDVV